MKNITLPAVVEALEAAVRRNPEYEYPSSVGSGADCKYSIVTADQERVRCIVGEILITDLEVVTDDDFASDELSGWNGYTAASGLLSRLCDLGKARVTDPNVPRLLDAIQMRQDRGHIWGNAVADGAHDAVEREGAEIDGDLLARLTDLQGL